MFLGDVPRLYQNIRPFLTSLRWNDVRSADTCAWLVAGCLESQRCSIPTWVSARISKAQVAQSREVQARHFLENPKVWGVSDFAQFKLSSFSLPFRSKVSSTPVLNGVFSACIPLRWS